MGRNRRLFKNVRMKRLREFLKIKNIKDLTSKILIAAFAAFFTYFLARYQDNQNAKEKYYKTFDIVEATLDWHTSQLRRLNDGLNHLRDASISEKYIIVDNFPVEFNSSIILSSVKELITYKKCDEKLIKLLVFYSNHLDELNYQIEFAPANKTIEKLKEEEIEESIRDYFASIENDYIKELELEIKLCKGMMENAR